MDNKVKDFCDEIDKMFFQDFENYDICPVFYLTQYCNLNCPKCYMFSNNQKDKNCLPTEDIKFYMTNLQKLPNFIKAVCFSGGEIFTLPVQYLKQNIDNAIGNNLSVELKTNGKWITDNVQCANICNMLREIHIPETNFGIDKCILKQKTTLLLKFKFSFLRLFNKHNPHYAKDFIKNNYGNYIFVSPLNITVSVDDIIHPKESIEWYNKILETVLKDDALRKNVCLGMHSFKKSVDMINLDKDTQITGKGSEYILLTDNYLHYLHLSKSPVNPKADLFDTQVDWHRKPIYRDGKIIERGRIDLFFWPDRTVSIDSMINFQPMGRISYVDTNGKYKDIDTIKIDIANKLKSEYLLNQK